MSPHMHRRPYSSYWCSEALFLFPNWPDANSGMYALALTLIFLLAAAAKGLSKAGAPKSNWALKICGQFGMALLRAALGYILVLSVNSYNGGVLIAAVLGHAAGSAVSEFGPGCKAQRPNPN